jgi:hypothetical protein
MGTVPFFKDMFFKAWMIYPSINSITAKGNLNHPLRVQLDTRSSCHLSCLMMGQTDRKMKRLKVEWLGYLGILGVIGFIWEPLNWLRYLSLLCLFFVAPYRNNLGMLFIVIFYAIGQGLALILARGRLPKPETYSQRTELILPFRGLWHVESGGIERKNSHSWHVLNQRYAYDFLIQDDQALTHTEDGEKLGDYYCFGQPIYVPGNGLVIHAKDGIPDNPRCGDVDWGARDFRGNYVVIQHNESEYSHLAHFKNGSLEVRRGDRVECGQRIGLCGNSGHSTQPHLNFHVQNRANFFLSIGLPVKFRNFVVRKEGQDQRIVYGYIAKGINVINAEQSGTDQERK